MGGIVLKPCLMKKMQQVKKTDDFELFEYTPSLLQAFGVEMEKVSFSWRIRCIIEYFSGYKVYYIKCGKDWAGYCIACNGRNPRYYFSTKRDIIFGRYFVLPEFRGRGLGLKMIHEVLDQVGLEYEIAYAYVHAGNKASNALMAKLRAELTGHFFKKGKLRRIVEDRNGDYNLYQYRPLIQNTEGGE